MVKTKFIENLIAAIEKEYVPSVLLSGGIDSSSILALAISELDKQPVAVTVSLLERGQDLRWAEKCQIWCDGHNTCNIEIMKHANTE